MSHKLSCFICFVVLTTTTILIVFKFRKIFYVCAYPVNGAGGYMFSGFPSVCAYVRVYSGGLILRPACFRLLVFIYFNFKISFKNCEVIVLFYWRPGTDRKCGRHIYTVRHNKNVTRLFCLFSIQLEIVTHVGWVWCLQSSDVAGCKLQIASGVWYLSRTPNRCSALC